MSDDDTIRVHFLKFLKVFMKKAAANPDHNREALLNEVVKITTVICNSPEFNKAKEYLHQYCQPREKQQDGYPALSSCLNEIIGLVNNADFPMLKERSLPEYAFHVHDPYTIEQKYTRVRTLCNPDLLLVLSLLRDPKIADFTASLMNLEGKLDLLSGHEEKLNQPTRDDLLNLKQRIVKTWETIDNPPLTFKWSDVLTTLEVRLVGTEGFSTPPEKFDGATPKDYYVLDDGNVKKGTRCASQRYLVAAGDDPLKEQPPPAQTSSRSDSQPLSSSDAYSSSSDRSYSDMDTDADYCDDYSPPDGVLTQSDIHTYLNGIISLLQIAPTTEAEDASSNPAPRSEGQADVESVSLIPRLRRLTKQRKLPPNEQNVLYGQELLCRGIYALHSINLIIVDDLASFWWYDRANSIQTTQLNFVEDMPYFVALLAAFQRFELRDWGVEPSLAPSSMFKDVSL